MKILIFGVKNVGKSTAGKILAEKIGYNFYDLDEEIKKEYQTTLEQFVHTENLLWRDHRRGRTIKRILKNDENMVFVLSPISYTENFEKIIHDDDILLIELYDSPKNIFDRLIFSDENDVLYKDDDYKNAHKDHIINDITEDLKWYGAVNKKLGVTNRIDMNNESPDKVSDIIIQEFLLNKVN